MMERREIKVTNGKNSVDKLPTMEANARDVHVCADDLKEYTYMGYKIRQASGAPPANPNRMAWDIYDGDRVRKGNISSLDTAKHVIDVMLKYGYWKAM